MAFATLAVLLAMLAAVAPAPEPAKPADNATCLSCHRDQASSYLHTAHFLTSQPATRNSILGSFREGSNVLMIADPAAAGDNPGLYFKMEARPDGFFQTAFAGWPGQLKTRSEKMEVVIGSGVRGQSYLYWRGDRLFELPVSYWSDGNRWINSPGYKDGTMNFSRAVIPRCLECHATSIKALSPDPLGNEYDPTTLVTAISCERCHGSGARHIALAQANAPGVAQAILNPAKLSRDRQVDLCALCHNGIRTDELVPAFSYRPGETLDNFLRPNEGDIGSHPDVHGNQVGLLEKSRCYLSSAKMSCSTCHNVHEPERAAVAYSDRCLSCHRVESCGMAKTMGPKIAENCIDCHMPVETTNAVASETAGHAIRPRMRNHWIKVYPGQS
jgi:Cytochrome c554 and c-prime